MVDYESVYEFRPGENRVFDRDLEGLVGHQCKFADVAAIAYLLASKGYILSRVFSDGFCVVLRNESEVKAVAEIIDHFPKMLASPNGEDAAKIKEFHKKADGIYLTALEKACFDTWKDLFPGLQEDDISSCMDSECRNGIHFVANVERMALREG